MIDTKYDICTILISSILLHIFNNDLDTESKKQQFLFDLAKLNSLVPKGYWAWRTDYDDYIYEVKQQACEFLATEMPDRCRYFYGGQGKHSSVLYIYANNRQYSFHVDLPPTIQVPKAREDEWDKIKESWQLSDAEYREERAASRRQEKTGLPVRSADDRRRALRYLAAAKEYRLKRDDIRDFSNRVQEMFWRELSSVLPAAKKKNKCFIDQDLHACHMRYFNLIETSFTVEEKQCLCDPQRYETCNAQELLSKYDRSISRAIPDIVEMLDSGKMSAERLYRIIIK